MQDQLIIDTEPINVTESCTAWLKDNQDSTFSLMLHVGAKDASASITVELGLEQLDNVVRACSIAVENRLRELRGDFE